MEYDSIEEWIRTENSGLPSVDDQLWLAQWAKQLGLSVGDDSVLRTKQIKDRTQDSVDHNPQTLLDNLEEIGVFEKIKPPGGRNFIRNERTGEMFYTPENQDFPPLLAEEIDRFLQDVQAERASAPITDGGSDAVRPTLRTVAAEALEVEPDEVEEEISKHPDPVERMIRYEKAVEAIIESEEVERKGNYDLMGWRKTANRWGLSVQAANLPFKEV